MNMEIMKRIKPKGIEVSVFEPELHEDMFFNSCVDSEFDSFKKVDIVLANWMFP